MAHEYFFGVLKVRRPERHEFLTHMLKRNPQMVFLCLCCFIDPRVKKICEARRNG